MPLSTTCLELMLYKEQGLEVAAMILSPMSFLEFLLMQMTSIVAGAEHAAVKVVELKYSMMQDRYKCDLFG